MKRGKRLPIPQKEFGFIPHTFNLFAEITIDGERLSREHEQAERDRQRAAQAQSALLEIER
jgi:hypothetical protein